jgi:hypothetical protein
MMSDAASKTSSSGTETEAEVGNKPECVNLKNGQGKLQSFALFTWFIYILAQGTGGLCPG